LPHPTAKARPPLSVDVHHKTNPHRPTPQSISGAQRRRAQLTLGSGIHRALGETSLPGRKTAGTRAIQGDLHGDRLRRHNQRAAHPTLPARQNKGRTGRNIHQRRANLPIQRGQRFFFRLFIGHPHPMARLKTGFLPNYCLLKYSFLQ
jgi:hypothetical protein